MTNDLNFCSNCGERISSNGNVEFCSKCGSNIRTNFENRDNRKHRDLTDIVFQSFKKAEPIMILATISLAIGALVSSTGNLIRIYDFSILSSFMFVFAFIFYVFYELYRNYWWSSKKNIGPEEDANERYLYNFVRFAPIYFSAAGILILLIIASQFAINSPNLDKIQDSGRKPIPIANLTALFFISYLVGYTIHSIVVNTIKAKNAQNIPTLSLIDFFGGKALILYTFFTFEIALVLQILDSPLVPSIKDLAFYNIYLLGSLGVVTIIRNSISNFKFVMQLKRKTKFSIVFIGISLFLLLTIPFMIVFILQGASILDKNFDIIEFLNNGTSNIIQFLNNGTSNIIQFLNNGTRNLSNQLTNQSIFQKKV